MCFDFHIEEKMFCMAKRKSLAGEDFFMGSVRIKELTPHDICYDITVTQKDDGSSVLDARAFIYWMNESSHRDNVVQAGGYIHKKSTPFFRSAFCNFEYSSSEFLTFTLSDFKQDFLARINTLAWRLTFEYYNFLDCLVPQSPPAFFA